LKEEHHVYKQAYRKSKLLNFLVLLLDLQINNKIKTYVKNDDGDSMKITHNRKGGRSSGDVNTSLGNYIIMCLMLYALCQAIGLEPGTDVCLIDDGDDFSLVGEADTIDRILRFDTFEWFKEMGYEMDWEEPVTVIEEIRFCQSFPCETAEGWIMVRLPVALDKDVMCLCDEHKFELWLSLIAEAGTIVYGHIPVVSAHYAGFSKKRLSTKQKNRLMNDNQFDKYGYMQMLMDTPKQGGTPSVISDVARSSFMRGTKITPSLQLAMEQVFNTHIRYDDVNLMKRRPLGEALNECQNWVIPVLA
jgi:hypothetical protein